MAQEERPVVATRPVAPREDLGGRLEVLRGWVAALDRIIGIRTRVLLVLAAIAIGASAAAIYLALDARSDQASKSDLDALRRQVGSGSAGESSTGALEARLQAAEQQASAARASVEELRGEVGALRSQLGAPGTGVPSGASGQTGAAGASGATGAGGAASPGKSGAGGAGGATVPSD